IDLQHRDVPRVSRTPPREECNLTPVGIWTGEIALTTTLRALRQFHLLVALACLLAAIAAHGANSSAERTRAEITAMLNSFLTPPAKNTAAGHERFWADDLVYTSSTGKVMSKADILKSIAEDAKAGAGKTAEPGPVFTAEDVLVRPYGDMAALTFRLVATDP